MPGRGLNTSVLAAETAINRATHENNAHAIRRIQTKADAKRGQTKMPHKELAH